jgi:phage shock protein A
MSGLFNAIKNTVRGWSGKATEALDDPTRDANFAIEDFEKQITSAERDIAKVIASNKGAERKIKGHESESKKYMNLAKAAKEKNDSESAQLFFQKHQTAQNSIGRSKVILTSNQTLVKQKREQIQEWKVNLENARATQDSFALRQSMNDATIAINELDTADKNGNGIPDHMEAAMDKLQQQEDILAAQEQMNSDPAADAERKYSTSNKSADFDAFMKG